MKVLYDHQIFEYQKTGGISRYFVELFKHFDTNSINFEIALKFSNNLYISQLTNLDINKIVDFREEFLKGINFPGKGRLFNALQQHYPDRYPIYYAENIKHSIDLIQKNDFDIFHPTYYNPYFLDYLGNKPFVLTIHDMTHEIYPEFISSNDQTVKWKRLLVKRANHIIAVSEAARNDIIDFYEIKKEKITVVHHGHNAQVYSKNRLISSEYFLYVGERKGYKNFLFLLLSIADILIRYNIKLVCTGNPFTDDEKKFFKDIMVETHVIHRFSMENELFSLYNNALALIFPSIYEGFGMPILEAFSANCPVVLSDTLCFREVAGDAALYFSPKDRDGIRKQVTKIINDQIIRAEMIGKGRARLDHFTWEESVAKHKDIYRSILKE